MSVDGGSDSPKRDAGGAGRRRWVIAARVVFLVYAVTLSTLTHWPMLVTGPAPFNLFDKVMHFGAFGLWTALLIGAGFFGRILTWRNVAWCVAVALVFSGLDELTQSIPGVNRHTSWSDYAANAAGALAAGCVAAAFVRVHNS